MTETEQQTLISALRASPSVLLLGQRFLAAQDEHNPVYAEIVEGDPKQFYTWWFQDAQPVSRRNELLHARGKAVALPEHFEPLRRLPWRCAFTSCIDPTPRRLLQVDSRRTVVERFQREDNPDFTALPLFRLFGSAGRPDSAELPPASPSALSLRRRAAREMLDALSELVTPHGRLFIEGWKPSIDWLRPQHLGPALVGLGEAQVLIFGLGPDDQEALWEDEDFQILREQGTVVLFEATLTALVKRLADAGELPRLDQKLLAPETVTVEVVERTQEKLEPPPPEKIRRVIMSQAEWHSLNETFTVLRERNLARPCGGTELERYQAFRAFLGQSPDLQLEQVAEFAFRRSVLDDAVLPAVLRLLHSPSPQDQALLVSGQSGVGKTTLLSLLAIELRAAGVPVVFVRRGAVLPNEIQLDRFAQMIERAEARVPTVVIYDGLLEGYEYLKLARSLGSRGRKVLVVGSTYETNYAPRHKRVSGRLPLQVVPVSVAMTPNERTQLLTHLKQFLVHDQATLTRLAKAGYDNFFATLYHLLDAARPRLRAGLVQEIEREASRLSQQLQEAAPQVEQAGVMQQALREALQGTIFEQFLATQEAAAQSAELKQKVNHLIDAVMVAGRFDVPVPQSIALRLLGNEHRAYQAAMRVCRILVEHEVVDGCCELTSRQPLEAEIWCQRQIPQKDNQVRLMREMALHVRSGEIANDHSSETTFVVDLLRAVGPQGREADRSPQLYPQIAEIVHELRQRHPRVSPRLLLIESNAIREWVSTQENRLRHSANQNDLTEADEEQIQVQCLPPVQTAADSIEQAIEMVCPSGVGGRLARGARRLLTTLHTELACIRGTELMCLQLLSRRLSAAPGLIMAVDACLEEATRSWRRALVYDEDSIQANDTACWILRNRLDGPGLSPERKIELLVRWEEVVEQYRSLSLSEQQQDKFDTRESELSQALSDLPRFEEVLRRMEERGGAAAHVLRARYLARDKGPAAARGYLEDQCREQLLPDRSVLLCYYRLWWQTETGEPGFFEHDSLVLPFRPLQWTRMAELARARLNLEGEQDNCMALFHLGWALLQGGEPQAAREVFDHLEIVSLESYRRGRTLALLSHPDGTPQAFFGETRGRRLGNRGLAWVEDLRLEVPFNLYEFPEGGSRPGRRVGPFHLALNYRGVFAQPTHRFSGRDPG